MKTITQLLDLLNDVQRYCPVHVQDDIRAAIAEPVRVFELFCETNDGEGIGYVYSTHATREIANAARLQAMDLAIARDTVLYFDERTMAEGEDNADDWEEDFVVREAMVHTTCPALDQIELDEIRDHLDAIDAGLATGTDRICVPTKEQRRELRRTRRLLTKRLQAEGVEV